jgi:hypothetical protein
MKSSDSGPANQSRYDQFSTPTPLSSHRRDSDAVDRGQRPAPAYSSPPRPTYPHDRPARNMNSYSALQYYRSDSPERRQDEGTRSSDPHPRTQNDSQREEYVSPDAEVYDATNDAFYFPPNSVSARGIQQRREMLNGMRGAGERQPPSDTGRYR